ncbi:hypothetical protein AMECASPLE_033801 [Ameca splendens]|uniref:Uncharacterized protein n=1 Tax=Ameca splendens TaxID=208324 RepID=A0ABV1A2A9_9TELE
MVKMNPCTAIQQAGKACDDAADIQVLAVNKRAYEMQLSFVEEVIHEAIKSLATWEIWVPAEERNSLDGKVRQLKVMRNKLQTRKSQFAVAQTIAEEKSKSAAAQSDFTSLPIQAQATSIVKIRPISLPKF